MQCDEGAAADEGEKKPGPRTGGQAAHISPDCKIGVSVTLLVGENPNRIVAGGGADVAHLKAPVLNHYGVLSVPPGGEPSRAIPLYHLNSPPPDSNPSRNCRTTTTALGRKPS